MILMQTAVLKRGVRYRVLDPTTLEIAWERVVMFSQQNANRPAGKAFKNAAREQEKIAKQMLECGYLTGGNK